jgi:uncharacterized phage protein (TIGR01671 family)
MFNAPFKAIDKYAKKWLYGSYLHLNIGKDYICNGTVFINTLQPCKDEIEKETICRNTYLNDKKGKPIYENDIVTGIFNYEKIQGVIKYGSDGCFFIDKKGTQGIGLNNCQDWLEVVGNIYDE